MNDASSRRGLAVVVACPGRLDDFLDGVIIDYESVISAFESKLSFAVLPLLRANKSEVKKVVKYIASSSLPKSCKALVFIFSGHGYSKYVCAQDKDLKIYKNIVLPLTAAEDKFAAQLPKLFFFDTCRGGKEDRGVPIKRTTNNERDDVTELYISAPFLPTHGNYLIGYSTKRRFAALATSKGSYWLQCLTRELCAPENSKLTITDILTVVNAKVVAKTANDGNTTNPADRHIQQPVIVSTLCQHLYFQKEGMVLKIKIYK